MIPTESIFLLGFMLARRGVLTTHEAAALGEYTYRSADWVLNKAARVAPVTKVADGTWLALDLHEVAQRVRPVLAMVRREMETSQEGITSLKRHDLAELVKALDALLGEIHD